MVEIYVIAEKAVSLIRGNRQIKESTKKTNMMLFTGILSLSLTPVTYLDPGNAPSLDIANTILVVTVICENPPKYTFISRRIDIANAPAKIGVPSALVKAI